MRIGASIIGLICTLFLIWLIFDFYGRTHVGVVGISLSRSSLDGPLIPFGERDAQKLQSLSSDSMLQPVVTLDQKADSRSVKDSFLGVPINELSQRDVLILYVNGECVLQQGADKKPKIAILDQANLLPLSKVLEPLKDSRLQQKKKLLLLDISRSRTDWDSGVLPAVIGDLVTKEVTKEVDNVKVRNLVVMLADTTSTNSYTSQYLPDAGSAFANFILQGLAGKADENPGPGGHDQRVSVEELFDFVKVNVVNWSSDCRNPNRPQIPVMIPETLPPDLNFSLAKMVLKSGGNPQTLDKKPLDMLYKERDQFSEGRFSEGRKGSDRRRAPLEWNRFHRVMLQVESSYLAQQPEFFNKNTVQLAKWIKQMEELPKSPSDRLPTERKVNSNYIKLAFSEEMGSQYRSGKPADSEVLGKLQQEEPLLTPAQISEYYLSKIPNSKYRSDVISIRNRTESIFSNRLGVFPWIEEDLKILDDEVRETENLVLAEGSDDKVLKQLQIAESQLKRVQNVAEAVEHAQGTLDHAFMILPQLTRWVGTRSPTRVPNEADRRFERSAGLLKWRNQKLDKDNGIWILGEGQFLTDREMPVIWSDSMLPNEYRNLPPDALELIEPRLIPLLVYARKAKELIPSPPMDADKRALTLEQLQQHCKALEQGLTLIEEQLEKYARETATAPINTPQPSDFRKISDLLALECIPAVYRSGLLDRYMTSDRTLNDNSKSLKNRDISVRESANSQYVAGDCMWQTFWMIQTASLSVSEADVATEVRSWSSAAVNSNQPKDQIYEAHGIAKRLVRNWKEAKKPIEAVLRRNDTERYAEYYSRLRDAELSARALPPRMADELLLSLPDNSPTIQLERAELLERLIVLAGRSAEDFWASPNESSDPWFKLSSKEFQANAEALGEKLPTATWAKAALDRIRSRTEVLATSKVVPLIEKGGNEVQFEFKSQAEKIINVQIEGLPPKGTSALRFKESDGPVEVNPKVSQVRLNGEVGQEQQVELHFQRSINAKSQSLPMEIGVTYRGHYWPSAEALMAVIPEDQGRKLSWKSSPATGSICLQGSSRRKILFVLDCSDSMRHPIDIPRGGDVKRDRKIDIALSTLKDVFLQQSRNGDRIGLATFGLVEREADFRVVPDLQLNVPISVLDNEHRNQLNGALTKLTKPSGIYTRCLGAIGFGLKQLDESGKDPGVLVLITDGATSDGDYDVKGNDNPSSEWDKLVGQYKLSQHEVVVIKYAIPNDPNDVTNQKRLVSFEKKATDRTYLQNRPFIVEDAPTAEQLQSVIEKVLKPREYYVVGVGDEPVALRLGQTQENLKVGRYAVQFDNQEFPVSLLPGQKLVLQADWDNGQYQLKRTKEASHGDQRVGVAVNADASVNSDSSPAGSPTLVAIKHIELKLPQGEKQEHGEVEIIAVLDHPDDQVAVVPPEELLFSVAAGGVPVDADITVAPAAGYQSPAYELQIAQWPLEQNASLQVAWKMKRTPPTEIIPFSDLDGNNQIERVIGNRKWRLSAYQSNGDDASVIVDLQPLDPPTRASESSTDFPLSTRMTRVELGTMSPVGFVLEPEGSRIVEVFQSGLIRSRLILGAGLTDTDLAGKSIAITLPEDLFAGAFWTAAISAPSFRTSVR